MKIEIPDDHSNPKNCQLFLAATGTKAHIKAALIQALSEIEDCHGKPRQGTVIQFDGASSIITPIWGGKEY